jgi:hypothetical protein
LIVSAIVAGGAVLAGCSSPGGSASPPSSAPSTTGATTSSSTLVTTAPTTTTTIPGCTGANFALSTLGSEGAAGTIEVTFGFRNTSSATCPLFGYPGIQLLGPGGAAIATTTVRGGSESFTNFAPANVSVAPGATAFFNLGYSDVPTGGESSCPTATGLQAIAPNTTTGLRVSGQFNVCNNATVTVSPVFGKGSPQTSTTAPPQS